MPCAGPPSDACRGRCSLQKDLGEDDWVGSTARRAEDQEGATGPGSGSGSPAGRCRCTFLLGLAAADGPYLCCPKNWVMHSPSMAQGRWKLRTQPNSAQLMVAPLPPQTKHCWKERVEQIPSEAGSGPPQLAPHLWAKHRIQALLRDTLQICLMDKARLIRQNFVLE